jgi:hypothetical protein
MPRIHRWIAISLLLVVAALASGCSMVAHPSGIEVGIIEEEAVGAQVHWDYEYYYDSPYWRWREYYDSYHGARYPYYYYYRDYPRYHYYWDHP